jgi:malate dehydrogenase (oxaloacetate-decarboxylating)(NADP+)
MQIKGLSQDEARSRISMFDINGLIEPSRADLSESQKAYAHKSEPSKDFVKTIESLKPTILIGVSAKGGAFNQRVVETMSRLNERPIIFALSNPTDRAECTAEQAYTWSKGKALYAAGVQFPEVTMNGKTFHPGQANNFYIFPAIGLATYVTRPRRITDELFIVAAEASADQVGPILREKGMLFPSQANILETEVTTATRVAEYMFDEGLAQVERPRDLRAWCEGEIGLRLDGRPGPHDVLGVGSRFVDGWRLSAPPATWPNSALSILFACQPTSRLSWRAAPAATLARIPV